MNKSRGLTFILISIAFVGIAFGIAYLGSVLNPGQEIPVGDLILSEEMPPGLQHPLAILLLQAIVVILVARIFGNLANRLGQPLIVGEIIAGIILGPTLFGYLFPEVFSFIFPLSSYSTLKLLSEIGLMFFLFIVGMDLDLRVFKSQAKSALFVSNASLMFTTLVGMGASFFFFKEYAGSGASFLSFSLFMGIAISITAFPILARIVQERGLSKTPLGSMAITCAAASDFTAWCFFAFVIIIARGGTFAQIIISTILAAGYVMLMLYVVQPLMKKVGSVYASKEIFNRKFVGVVFLILVGSSFLSDAIGVHALFGAFLAGVIMPQNLSFKKIMTDKIEDVSIVLFLPLFFVYTGLHMQFGLFTELNSWIAFVSILLLSVVGKVGGTALAARWVGQSWKNSVSLGALMNTRGLIEIVVLGIGLELGILSSSIFTIMVLMALVSTVLTNPLLDFIDSKFKSEGLNEGVVPKVKSSFRILISFGPPKMGSTLLRLADQLTLKLNKKVDVNALHITPSNDVKPYEAILYEREGFQPIRATAQLLGLRLETLYRNTEDIDREIYDTVENGNFDLVLVGAARPMFNSKATGGILKQLLNDSQSNIGVLVDRGFVMAEGLLVLLGSEEDRSLLQYAYRLKVSNKARVTILKIGDGQSVDLNDEHALYYQYASSFNEVIEQRIPDKQLLGHFNLILVGLDEWNELNSTRAPWIKDCPSVLVVKHSQDLISDVELKSSAKKEKLSEI